MKMKLNEVKEKLNDLIELENLNLPVKVGYAISCNMEKLLQINERLEKERVKICEKMAAKDVEGKAIVEDGKYLFAKPEDEEAVMTEYKELLEEEEEVELRTCPVKELYKCEENERFAVPTAKDIKKLSFMLTEK